MRTGVRWIGAGTAVVLVAIGLLHLIWTMTPWPLSSATEFARVVVGVRADELPPDWASATVAGLLLAAAVLVAAGAGWLRPAWPRPIQLAGVWTVAGVLLARGIGGLIMSGLALADGSGFENPAGFDQWDVWVYSPLCVLLGLGAGLVAVRGVPAVPVEAR